MDSHKKLDKKNSSIEEDTLAPRQDGGLPDPAQHTH